MRDGARADGGVVVVVGLVLLDLRRGGVGVGVLAREGPQGRAVEVWVLPAGQRLVDDLVELVLARVVELAEGLRHLLLRAVRHVERRERGLLGAAGADLLKVAAQDLLGLRGEVEDHVDVDEVEMALGGLDAFEDLLARAVLLVAVHLLEQAVVEALHAHGEALHAALHLRKPRVHQVVGVGLHGHLGDGEVLARLVDGGAQLVKQDGGRAAAEVETLKVVAKVLEHHHLFAHVGKVGPGHLLAEVVAVEAAVGAQHLTERNMQVEHVFTAGFGGREMRLGRRLENKLRLGHGAHDGGEESFSEQGSRLQ